MTDTEKLKVGDNCLYHDTENGKDELLTVRVMEVAPAWTTGTVPVRVRHQGRDRWVPMTLLQRAENADV